MPKISNKLKSIRLKYFKFIYTQTELLDLVKYLKTNIDTKASNLYKCETKDKVLEVQKLQNEIKSIQKIRRKVKTRLAVNNILFGMNRRIFLRDDLGRELEILTAFSEGKHTGDKKELFNGLKPLYIETRISDMVRKRKKISEFQSKRNRWIPSLLFCKSPVLENFERRRIKI